MFSALFLISAILLTLTLAAQALLKRQLRILPVLILTFSITTLLFLIGFYIEHTYPDRFLLLHPWALAWLVVPAAVLAASTALRSWFTPRINFPRTGITAYTGGLRATLTKWLCLGLNVAALGLIVLALARPVAIDRTTLPPTQGIDIMMVLDVSGSMSAQDFYPNRFVAAQKTAGDFIGKRLNDRIGLVVFAKNAMLAAPLTLDHQAVQELVASLYMGMINANATAIGDALGVAASHLKDSSAKSKIIVLLTDGSNNAGTIDPRLAAKAAASYAIKVYTIATASPPGSTLASSATEEIDEPLLLEIAKSTGGKFYRAKNELELQNIYDTINRLEKTQFEQTALTDRSDLYFPFVLAALALLLISFMLEKLFFIKVP